MFVDERVEGHPVPPAGGEVVDVDVWISGQEEEIRACDDALLVIFTSLHIHSVMLV